MMPHFTYAATACTNMPKNPIKLAYIPQTGTTGTISPTAGYATQGMMFNYKDKYMIYLNSWGGVYATNDPRTQEKNPWIEIVRYNDLNNFNDYTISPKIYPFTAAAYNITASGANWTIGSTPTPSGQPANIASAGYTYSGVGTDNLVTDYVPEIGENYNVFITVLTPGVAGTLTITLGGQTQTYALSTSTSSNTIYFDNITTTAPLTVIPYASFTGTVKISPQPVNCTSALFKLENDDDNLYVVYKSYNDSYKVDTLKNSGSSTYIKIMRFNIHTMTSSFIDYEVVLEYKNSNFPQPFPTDLNSKQNNYSVSVVNDGTYIYTSDCSPYPVVNKFLIGTTLGTWTHQGRYTSTIRSGYSMIAYNKGYLFLVHSVNPTIESYKDGIYNNGANTYYGDQIGIIKIDAATMTSVATTGIPSASSGITNAKYGGLCRFNGTTYTSNNLFGSFPSQLMNLYNHQTSSFTQNTKGLVVINDKIYISNSYYSQSGAFSCIDTNDITIQKSYNIPGFALRASGFLYAIDDQLFYAYGTYFVNETKKYFDSSSVTGEVFAPVTRIAQFDTQTEKFIFLKEMPISVSSGYENSYTAYNYFHTGTFSKDGSILYSTGIGSSTAILNTFQKSRFSFI